MFLQEITLRNIKCFKEVTVDFSDRVHHPNDAAPIRRWTTLFGMNGLGKSTLLQAIGIALAGQGSVKELMSDCDGWVRKGCSFGEIEAKLLWTEGDAPMKRPRKTTPFTIRYLIAGTDKAKLPMSLVEKPNPGDILAWSGEESPKSKENYTKDRGMLQETAYQEQARGWLSCGYGPFRRLSGGSEFANNIVSKGRRSARFVTLFREDAAVTNATEWLMSLHNESRDGYAESKKALECVRAALKDKLFPEPVELIVDSKNVRLRREGQDSFAFQDLSDGYRSMLSLSIDLLRWLIKAFPNEQDVTKRSGVVLIDELDTHLHPKWQREIGFWLKEKFPNIQFIIGTHSPFLAQVADDEGTDPLDLKNPGNIKLVQGVDGVSTIHSNENSRVLSPEQILQSELFGMESVLSPPIEIKRKRLLELSLKQTDKKLEINEQEELKQLSFELERLPIGLAPEDRVKEATLRAALDSAKDSLQSLK